MELCRAPLSEPERDLLLMGCGLRLRWIFGLVMSPAASRLVIVDGTHLCLLPELSSSSSSSASLGGGKKCSNNTSRNKSDNNNGSKRTTDDGDISDEEKKMVDVLALPLSLIRDVFVGGCGGGKCIYPFVDNDNDDDRDVALIKKEGGLGVDDSSSRGGRVMTKHDIRTIRLLASDLMCDNNDNDDNINDNSYGRFVRSTNLLTADDGQPSTVVRIITSCTKDVIEGASMQHITPQVEEDVRSDNDDDYDASNCSSNILQIVLPSLASLSFDDDVESLSYFSSSCHYGGGGGPDVIYYSGEQHGIVSSSTKAKCNKFDYDNEEYENDEEPSCAIEVHGAASVLVHDFLGIPGLEQCLILPRFVSDTTSPTVDMSKEDMLLAMIQSSILTDGVGLLLLLSDHMDSSSVKISTTMTNKSQDVGNRVRCTIATIELSPVYEVSLSQVLDNNTMKNITSSNKTDITLKNNNSIMPKQNDEADGNMMMTMTNEIISKEEDQQPTTPAWVDAIARTVQHRLDRETKELEQFTGSIEAGCSLVHDGQKTIQSMYSHPQSAATCEEKSSLMNDGGGGEPEVVRLRYGVRPRMSNDIHSSTISATIDMEVDVIFRAIGGSNSHHVVLHDFHLSCSLLRDNKNSAMSVTTAMANVRTLCGIVPTFRNGDCVTILASLTLVDLRVNSDEHIGQSSTVDISIQGLWADDDSSTTYGDKALRRRGTVLCILRVPTEILFLAPPITSPSQFGRWIQYEITFSNDDDGLTPSAIFEYLHPQTIIIDKSDNVQDMNIWKQFVLTMNADLGGNSFIDLYAAKGDPRLKLVVFGSNPEERAVSVKHVLRSLPESAKLILEDVNDKEHVKALLMSLKKEADILKKHRSSASSGGITPDSIAEIASLQSNTDGIASTFKQGWV